MKIPGRVLLSVATILTSVSAARAQSTQSDPAKPMLDEAGSIVSDLWGKKEFFKGYRTEALVAQYAALKYGVDPRIGLDWAREVDSQFFASLALGACAAQSIKSDPDGALQLIQGAQEHALSNKGYVGTDATSLTYLFQLNPLFETARARQLLAASRRNLKQFGSGLEASKPALELAHQVVLLDPANVEAYLNEVIAIGGGQTHLYESVQFLGGYLARIRKEWAASQVSAFYASGKALPGTGSVLFAVLMEDALGDVPKALEKINAMQVEDQDQARFYIAVTLREAGRTKEAVAIVAQLQARIDAKAPGTGWIAGVLPGTRERWDSDDTRAKIVVPGPPGPDQIDAFIARPDGNSEFMDRRDLHFRDVRQALAYVDKTLPLARAAVDRAGGRGFLPGSRRSAILGNLAQIAALAGEPGQAKEFADEITIPEFRAFYLMTAYEAARPLPKVVRGWPIFLYVSPENVVGQP